VAVDGKTTRLIVVFAPLFPAANRA